MPGGGNGKTFDSDLRSIASSRRQSVASIATFSTVNGLSQPHQRLSQADYFSVKGPNDNDTGRFLSSGANTPRESVVGDALSPFTPSPSMFPAPPGSAIQTTTLTTQRSRSSLQPIPASPLTASWDSSLTPRMPGDATGNALSPALSGHTLVSPSGSDFMQRPEKAYSPVQEGRPPVSRFTSSETAASVTTAQSTAGLAPLTRQQGGNNNNNNRESWQSGKTNRSSRRPNSQIRSSLQPAGGNDDMSMEKGFVVETSGPAAKNYTTFTGFRPYSVHSSYTYIDDGESEVGVPPPSGGTMGDVAGKPQFMGSDGLPVRPTAEMQQRARKRKVILRWAWAIGVLCFLAVVVGISVGMLNAFHTPK